ncbi:MAG TPA: ABC transporter permease, partial [Variovorax sp.]|nr:ABC transporter permease [Variovorax sp.]
MSELPPSVATAVVEDAPFVPPRWRWMRKHPTLIVGGLLLVAVAAVSIGAPWIATLDPQDIDPL